MKDQIFHLLQKIADSKDPANATRALGQLYSAYHTIVEKACAMVCKKYNKPNEDIEDLIQDVWEKIVHIAHLFAPQKFKSGTEEDKFFRWIASVGKRMLFQAHKNEGLVANAVLDFARVAYATHGEEGIDTQREKVRSYLETLEVHELDIILTTMKYRPYYVPRLENKRLRETHKLKAFNIRQIRRRILLKIAEFLLDKQEA